MTIALIGANGQLGTEIAAALSGRAVCLARSQLDLTVPESVEATLDSAGATVVINAAAYNLVDRAEDEPEIAFAVNALGPRHLAKYCASRDIPLVHISTDFVFGLAGLRNSPYVESDAPGPQGAYAVSKLAGEYFVRELCPRHFVLRTCGLYGRNPRHGNFVETMLRLARERKSLRVVDDQRCTPTSTWHLARAIVVLMQTGAYGLYHATNGGATTWYRFAAEIFRLRSCEVELLPITTAEYGAKAKRPAFSVLDCRKLENAIGYRLPNWTEALAEYLKDGPAPTAVDLTA